MAFMVFIQRKNPTRASKQNISPSLWHLTVNHVICACHNQLCLCAIHCTPYGLDCVRDCVCCSVCVCVYVRAIVYMCVPVLCTLALVCMYVCAVPCMQPPREAHHFLVL